MKTAGWLSATLVRIFLRFGGRCSHLHDRSSVVSSLRRVVRAWIMAGAGRNNQCVTPGSTATGIASAVGAVRHSEKFLHAVLEM
jgi:hypothetical protein